jgi:GGDEF domain-containing protein
MVTNLGEIATHIGKIVKNVPYIVPSVKNKEVDKLFTNNPDTRGLVVVHHEKPIAHITRTHFYQKIGTLYGYNLYMGRESKLLAKTDPLIVDYYQSITEVSRLAMEREEEDLYDDVIVTKDGKFIGVVSIRALLMKFVEIQVEFASFLNPLSNLPGNHLIFEKLVETISLEQFSLLYFDLDYFKTYNDLYGFNRGDQVLLHLTEILKRNILHSGYFLGHIGGDDFMALIPHYDVESICENIIKEFDETIPNFYDPSHLSEPNFKVKGRSGQLENFFIMTLSIAVLTNKQRKFEKAEDLSNEVAAIKRYCKKIKGSCYIIDNYD